MARPSFQANDTQRDLVKSLAILGMQHEEICQVIGIRSAKTLRKHFRSELAEGSVHAVAAVARTAFDMATSGRYPAMTLFWEKCQRDARVEREREKVEKERLEALGRPAPLELIFCGRREEEDAE